MDQRSPLGAGAPALCHPLLRAMWLRLGPSAAVSTGEFPPGRLPRALSPRDVGLPPAWLRARGARLRALHRAGAHTWGFGAVAGCAAGDCPKSLERATVPWPERFPPSAPEENLLPWLFFPAPVLQ